MNRTEQRPGSGAERNDRRELGSRRSQAPALLVGLAGIAMLSGPFALLAAERFDGADGVARLAMALRVVAAALFFGSGVLRISHWRISGERHSALCGVALVVFGSLTFPLTSLAVFVHEDPAATSLSPVMRAMTMVIVVGLLLFVLNGSDQELRPGPLTLWALCLALSAFMALVLVHHGLGVSLDPVARVHGFLELSMAAAWFGTAAIARWRSRRSSATWAGRVAFALAIMGMVGLLRAAAVHDLTVWGLGAAMLGAALAAAVLANAMVDIAHAAADARISRQATRHALASAVQVLSARDHRREELTHDACNAITALRAASTAMARYGEHLDTPARQQLNTAILGEIGHLEHLITSSGDELTADIDFDVQQAIGPVIEAQRAAGLVVDVRLRDHRVHGQPGDLATVVRNLLVNAHLHATGSPVTIWSRPQGQDLQIFVQDAGPGVAPDQREEIFCRGVRGETSSGSGLGMHVARTLMRRHRGDIELRDCVDGGATFVLTLPRATPQVRSQENKGSRSPSRRAYAGAGMPFQAAT